ncbi:MAG: nucleotidyl transferase AbiEii/AbiGii toxin family protein [Staphylococcus sp.]|nr:nucleotidyl transferase AbiEii/AbiGii toxin family protein [Anaeroplasma bactoclasticum]MCM1196073.1 nucleotidyl transferase AbiEii/AbiGii toxin family protein [Roseburia sp.]MCM1261057.1 nucleotidyl transferase AbiEii/AbiGii toxin family protein [Staphylococcus sp.]MCM1557422.1 nucleotidyl transferase AbiEii/AbiGii toxin family protein [Anaeroplasma bactoclasticum]
MNSVVEEIINSRNPKSIDEAKGILREVVQSVVLVGLSRAGFFNKASFYGGTALRIFYGLNRYSEDLDFTLNAKEASFSLEPYLKCIRDVATSYGFDMKFAIKDKKIDTPIESAFDKLNTYQTFISMHLDEKLFKILHKDEVLKVKLEVDYNPALGFEIESRWLDMPEFATVNVLNESSLFAGKIHAILCRNYKNQVKGRDYYDFLFYISKRVKPNLNYLKNKLIESGKLEPNNDFTMEILQDMLTARFNEVDFEQVKNDATRFLFSNENLSYYSKELFLDCVRKLGE